MFGLDDDMDPLGLGSHGAAAEISPVREKSAKGKTKTVGVLEKKANMTVVGGEVVIGREGRGDVKFVMLVSYTYRSDEPPVDDDPDLKSRTSTTPAKITPELKTFSFYTVVDLGVIVPKEETRLELADMN